MSARRFTGDAVFFWGFLTLMAGWAVWGAVLYLPDTWFFVVFPSGFVIAALLIWWRTHELPWNRRGRRDVPRLTKIRLTLHYLAARPWHRWRCRGRKATPLARFAALHHHVRHHRSLWYYGIPVEDFAGLFLDPNPRISTRVTETFTGAGITGTTLRLAEELPVDTLADLTQLLTMRAGYFHQPGALTLAWRMWLAYGDENLWHRLDVQNQVAPTEPLHTIGKLALGLASLDDMRAGAMDPAVPRRARSKAAEHLKRLGEIPDDAVEAAPLLAMSGLTDEYRRLDPDGSLLSMAYAGMDSGRRSRLRAVLADLGELDLLRQLRGAVASGAGVTGSDDSPQRRWRAVLAAPLLETVAAAKRVGDWRPEDPVDARLLERLRDTDIDRLRTVHQRITTDRQQRLDLPGAADQVGPAGFSPDGDRVAVAVRVRRRGWRFREFDAATGEVLGEQAAHPRSTVVALAHTGTGIAALNRPHAGDFRRMGLTFTADGSTRVLDETRFNGRQPLWLWRWRSGFLTCDGFTVTGYDAEGTAVAMPDLDGETVITPASFNSRPPHWVYGLDADPVRGRIVAGFGRGLHVHDPDSGVTLRAASEHPDLAAKPYLKMQSVDEVPLFLDPETILTTRSDPTGCLMVSQWRATATVLTRHAIVAFEDDESLRHHGGRCRPYRLDSGRGVLVVTDRGTKDAPEQTMFTLDTTTLERIHTPPQFGWWLLAASPDTRTFVGRATSERDPGASLRRLAPHPLAGPVDAPLSELQLSDLAVVAKQLERAPAAERPLTELLHLLLRHRFGDDIALGGTATGTDYDIALGGRDRPGDHGIAQGGQR